MVNAARALFSSKLGESAYNKILEFIEEYRMDDLIRRGALIGLSGGADSVFLSLFISEYRKRLGMDFPVLAVHINHMIRGEEALRDELLSRRIANELGFEFESFSIDVPALSQSTGDSIELAARNARYSKFEEIIAGREDLSCIITAHNSTDNVETVIFNLARGCGLNGASGILPVRGSVVRPLLPISKSEIVAVLSEFKIEFAVDSTNFSPQYTRNYIRHEILPRLDRINPRFESSFRSFSDMAIIDNDFIAQEVDKAMMETSDSVKREYLISLHPAIRSRVLSRFCFSYTSKALEKVQIDAISELLAKDNFRFSIGEGFDFVCERGVCSVRPIASFGRDYFSMPIYIGDNKVPGYNMVITLLPREENSPNIYNNSIKADLSSAIINSELYVRFRCDGDAYHYGGMTRKLKKVFNDLDILPSHRDLIPVICDANGIVWVPGLDVRDDCSKGAGYQYCIVISKVASDDGNDIYFAHKEIH